MTAKRCSRCRVVKPHESFHRSGQSRDGRQGYCKACVREHARERAAQRPKTRRERKSAPIGFKHCTNCDAVKPLDDFCRNASSGDGHAQYCKPCHNARGKETRVRLYGGGRNYQLLRRYGISAVDADALFEAQGGVCAICQEPPETWHVDHDHKTGKVRAILCFNCNQGLGNFRDRPEVLEAAIAYLHAFGGAPEEATSFELLRLRRLPPDGPLLVARATRLKRAYALARAV